MKSISLRLHPGQDLKIELDRLAREYQLEAACIIACVGSLTTARLRFANREDATELTGHFEIVSLEGVFSKYGSHFHIAIADGSGRTMGAHLLEGSVIYTTAEIVIGVVADTSFKRELDPQTGYTELSISYTTTE